MCGCTIKGKTTSILVSCKSWPKYKSICLFFKQNEWVFIASLRSSPCIECTWPSRWNFKFESVLQIGTSRQGHMFTCWKWTLTWAGRPGQSHSKNILHWQGIEPTDPLCSLCKQNMMTAMALRLTLVLAFNDTWPSIMMQRETTHQGTSVGQFLSQAQTSICWALSSKQASCGKYQ